MISEKDIIGKEIVKTPINIDTNDMTKMNLEQKSINPNIPREDKKVTIIDGEALKNISYIMMGYNEEGLVLGDGSFVSVSDIANALNEAYQRQPEGTFIVDSINHRISLDALNTILRLVAVKRAGAVNVKGPNPNITNQDSRNWDVVNMGRRPVNKGTAFLGNTGITLDSGLYISLEEVINELRKYMFARYVVRIRPPKHDPTPGPIPYDPEIPNDETTVAKITDHTNVPIIPLIAAGAAVVSGFGAETYGATQDLEHTVESTETIGDMQESVEKAKQDVVMGIELPVYEGQVFHSHAADGGGVYKQMGPVFNAENKYEGNYRVTGFAITYNGKLVPGAYIQDFYGQDNETRLQDFLEEQLTKHNLNIEDVEIMIHMGNSTDNTRLGWININELINENTLTDDMIVLKTVTTGYYMGTTQNFVGDYITLDNGAQIRVTDANGNLLAPGTVVIGSDNQEYTIKNLAYTNYQPEHKEIFYHLSGPKLAIALGGAGLFLANYIRTRLKNKNKLDESLFYKFTREEDYNRFKEKFIEAKKEYEKKSRFTRILKNILLGRETQILQRLTDEQTKELYSIIQKYNGSKYQIGTMDTIVFSNGDICIQRQNGQLDNIMPFIIDDIKGLGVKNKVDAEGRIEDERRER